MEIYEDKYDQSGDKILSSHITKYNICGAGSDNNHAHTYMRIQACNLVEMFISMSYWNFSR